MSGRAIAFIETPLEHAGAYETAWRRSRQFCYGLPPSVLEALKPLIVSIYMQGMMDGCDAKAHEYERSDKEAAALHRLPAMFRAHESNSTD